MRDISTWRMKPTFLATLWLLTSGCILTPGKSAQPASALVTMNMAAREPAVSDQTPSQDGGGFVSTPPEATSQDAPLPGPGAPRIANAHPLVSGMTFGGPACRPGATEQCNGIDDNCNGQIDERCADIQGGDLQVTLSYDQNVEIYMTVESPVGGHRLSRNDNDAQYGGTFQHPRQQRCQFARASDRLENAVWRSDHLPRGRYKVALRFYSNCSQDNVTSANVTLALAAGGRSVGTYRWTAPHDPFGRNDYTVLEFDVQ